MQVEAVLFDLFDTLLLLAKDKDFYILSLRRLHEFLVKNGINVSFEDFGSVYFEVTGSLYVETEKSLEEPHFNVRVSLVLQRFGHNLDVSHPLVVGATEAFANEFMRYVHLDGDALDVLRRLHTKYRLGLVSNFPIPECVWKLLQKFNLKGFFDVILISGEINKRKPSPEIFKRALNILHMDASKTVFVGDMIDLDVKGAKNAGIRAILIKRRLLERIRNVRPSRLVSDLRGLLKSTVGIKPDKVVRSLRELPVILESF